MRLVPDTLFGRLMLALVAGLLLAQLLSAGIHFYDRGQALRMALGRQAAQRIAATVELLDDLPGAQRERVAAAFSGPPLALRLSGEAPVFPESREPPALLMGAMLRRRLDKDRPLRVQLIDIRDSRSESWRMRHRPELGGPRPGDLRHRMHRPLWRGGFAFRVAARLSDGTWAVFEHRVPRDAFSWPMKLLLSLVVLVAGVLAIAWFVVRRMTQPLTMLATAADTLGRDIEAAPLSEEGPLEVRRAIHAFNTMQSRIRRYVQGRARILAAVSHDLKTPITRLRLRAEMLDDPARQAKFTGDLDDMEHMVNATLAFMRGADSSESVQPVDIDALLETLVENAGEGGSQMQKTGDALRPYDGRPLALKRCLTNLTENALRYAEAVEIRVEDAADQLIIRVLDRGPGMPASALERAFEPFFRLDASRDRSTGGTGLGLGIARNIARGHGGDLELRNRAGGGLEAVLSLPR